MARSSTSSGSDGAKSAPEKATPAAKSAPAKKSAAARSKDGKEAPVSAEPERVPAAKAGSRATKAPAPAGAARTTPAKPAPTKARAVGGYAGDEEFLASQRAALLAERDTYLEQARSLRAEAESLVTEAEPGDVQFDEESGEGGTTTVDRERDLALSAQALAAVEEIAAALEKIEQGRYGICEGCGELIPKPRLEALPYARLCIACKSGGLSRR